MKTKFPLALILAPLAFLFILFGFHQLSGYAERQETKERVEAVNDWIVKNHSELISISIKEEKFANLPYNVGEPHQWQHYDITYRDSARTAISAEDNALHYGQAAVKTQQQADSLLKHNPKAAKQAQQNAAELKAQEINAYIAYYETLKHIHQLSTQEEPNMRLVTFERCYSTEDRNTREQHVLTVFFKHVAEIHEVVLDADDNEEEQRLRDTIDNALQTDIEQIDNYIALLREQL